MTTVDDNLSGLSAEEIEAAKKIRELREEMSVFQSGMSALKQQQDEKNEAKEAAYAEYMKRVAELDKEYEGINRRIIETRRSIEAAQAAIERNERILEQANAIREAEAEFDRITSAWVDKTAGAPWREFADDYQIFAGKLVAKNRRVVIADVMGLGKTLESIVAVDLIRAATGEGDIWTERKRTGWDGSYVDEEFNAPPAGRRVLYLSPAALVSNVTPEWKRWRNTRPIVLAGKNRAHRRVLLEVVHEMDEVIVQANYEMWRKDKAFVDELIQVGFDTVILDEAHYLKDRGSIAYRGVRAILDGTSFTDESKDYWTGDYASYTRIGEPVRFVIPMTGTPVLNRPQELYSILTLVDPKLYPPTRKGENDFLYNYCDQIDQNKWRFNAGGLESLGEKIRNRFIRRTLKDVGIKLPPQEIKIHELDIDDELYPEQAKARKDMREKAYLLFDAEKGWASTAPAVITMYLRLRQIETWPAGITLKDGDGMVVANYNVEESQKVDYVISKDGTEGILPEVCPDQRAIVYSQFTAPLEEMQRRAEAAGLRAVILNGNTPQSIKDEIKIDFDRNRCREDGREPKWDVVFCNYKVGSEGLNFTDATQTIILDEEWNPGKRDQAYARTFRRGQTEETAVHVIRMAKTVDTWLAALIAEKEKDTSGFESVISVDKLKDALKNGEV